MVQKSIPAMIIRGGTSKGVYFKRSDLPSDESTWDQVLLRVFGSPDSMQIDGIGGSHSTTSKAMIVSPSQKDDFDLDYRFAQVSINNDTVDWGGNCGNLTFGVGIFGIESGMVKTIPSHATNLALYNENTNSAIEQSLSTTQDGSPQYEGDFTVYGVPGTGSPIRSRFVDPSGSVTNKLLPTGHTSEVISVDSIGDIAISIVDVTTPCVFVNASDLGVSAAISPAEINGDSDLLSTLEYIRSIACERAGIVDDFKNATSHSPGFPKVAIVGNPCDYTTLSGDKITSSNHDILARIMSMQKAHPAYAVTGAMCTASAALLEGTIPNQALSPTHSGDSIILGHPKGTMRIGVGIVNNEITYTEADRTSRTIMEGNLFY
ncbi:MAG: 2-methylaconitate cis-trans isomerase PrpF family protein [Halobacteriales archaeon]